jgi:sulfoxide reductase heme-binding subunit YedZ
MKTDPTFWLLARASGLAAYVLITASVLAGLVLKSRPFGRALKAASVTDVHRFLALLGLGMLALHGVSLTLDHTVHISPLALVLPGASAYRPVPVALGVFACELAALIVISFSVRRRIGMRNWRRLHWATYLVFLAATVHGLAAGTDSARPLARALYLGGRGRRHVRDGVACAHAPHATTRKRKEHVMFKVVIDRSLCSGFGSCAELAPEIFEVDDRGLVSLRVGTSEDGAVLDAASSCPMAAISVVEVRAA